MTTGIQWTDEALGQHAMLSEKNRLYLDRSWVAPRPVQPFPNVLGFLGAITGPAGGNYVSRDRLPSSRHWFDVVPRLCGAIAVSAFTIERLQQKIRRVCWNLRYPTLSRMDVLTPSVAVIGISCVALSVPRIDVRLAHSSTNLSSRLPIAALSAPRHSESRHESTFWYGRSGRGSRVLAFSTNIAPAVGAALVNAESQNRLFDSAL